MDLDNMNCEVEEVGMGKFILIWPTHIFGMEDSDRSFFNLSVESDISVGAFMVLQVLLLLLKKSHFY